MIKKAAIFSSGSALGLLVGGAAGLIAGLALHVVIVEEALEALQKAAKKGTK